MDMEVHTFKENSSLITKIQYINAIKEPFVLLNSLIYVLNGK